VECTDIVLAGFGDQGIGLRLYTKIKRTGGSTGFRVQGLRFRDGD